MPFSSPLSGTSGAKPFSRRSSEVFSNSAASAAVSVLLPLSASGRSSGAGFWLLQTPWMSGSPHGVLFCACSEALMQRSKASNTVPRMIVTSRTCRPKTVDLVAYVIRNSLIRLPPRIDFLVRRR